MLNKLLKGLILVSFFISSSFAANETVICPNPRVVKNIIFDQIEKGDHPDVWTLIAKNRFQTPYQWKFALMVEAKNKKEAMKKIKRALPKLHKTQGPEKVDNVWICDYKAPSLMSAVAILQGQTRIR